MGTMAGGEGRILDLPQVVRGLDLGLWLQLCHLSCLRVSLMLKLCLGAVQATTFLIRGSDIFCCLELCYTHCACFTLLR